MKPKVSIIVPVYNVEAYLSECLDSLINQTFKDIEIICIEDCSTDNSLIELEKYLQIDSRIKLIKHDKNCGLSVVRNTGLREAEGEYVYFMDSDDILDNRMIESCYNIAKNNNIDVVFFDAEIFVDPGYTNNYLPNYLRKELLSNIAFQVVENSKMLNLLYLKDAFIPSVWLNFIKRELLVLNDMQFYPNIIHEDELFTPKLYCVANKMVYIPETYFHRRLRNSSIMTAAKTDKRIDSLITVLDELYKLYLNLKNKELRKFVKLRINTLYKFVTSQLIINSNYSHSNIEQNKFYKDLIHKSQMKKVTSKVENQVRKLLQSIIGQ